MEEPFDRAWRRVGLALDRIGFTVEDRDRAQGLYFVRYVDPDADNKSPSKGFLSRLAFWRSDDKPVQGGSEYRRQYYSFEEGFTSNLKDSAALVQLTLAVSTQHDGRVLQWLARHELAIRSAVLVELASTPEDDVFTAEGKQRLQARLVKAINGVLTQQEGFGGVDAVHFRSFLVQ